MKLTSKVNEIFFKTIHNAWRKFGSSFSSILAAVFENNPVEGFGLCCIYIDNAMSNQLLRHILLITPNGSFSHDAILSPKKGSYEEFPWFMHIFSHLFLDFSADFSSISPHTFPPDLRTEIVRPALPRDIALKRGPNQPNLCHWQIKKCKN